MKKNILIIFGGRSYEHDISIISTFQCLKSFDEYLYNIKMIYIDVDGNWKLINSRGLDKFLKERESAFNVQLGVNDCCVYIKKKNRMKKLFNIDIVVPIIHGLNSEDGVLAGFLKMCNVPFVGCDNISAGIGIDKEKFKKICSEFPLLKYVSIDESNLENESLLIENIERKVGFPCIIKPNKLGSSIGIISCENKENFAKNIKKSLNYDKKVIVEPFVSKMREFNVALFRYENDFVVSEIEEPFHKEKILSFKDKYLNFSEQNIDKDIPAKLSKRLRQDIINIAKNCYDACGCSGVVRVDFIFDSENKKLYLNEINTIPGAMALYLFESCGIEKKEVVNMLIHETLRLFDIELNNKIEYNSEVLFNQKLSKFN